MQRVDIGLRTRLGKLDDESIPYASWQHEIIRFLVVVVVLLAGRSCGGF